ESAPVERLERGSENDRSRVRVAVELARRGDPSTLESMQQALDVDRPVRAQRRLRCVRIVEPVRVLEEVTRGRLAENLRRGAEETPRGHVEVHAQRAELALEQRGDEELRRAPGPEDFVLGASFADCRDSAAAARAERDDRSRRLRTRERELEPPLQSAGR